MDGKTFVLIETFGFAGLALAWGFWELRKIRKIRRDDAAKREADSETGRDNRVS